MGDRDDKIDALIRAMNAPITPSEHLFPEIRLIREKMEKKKLEREKLAKRGPSGAPRSEACDPGPRAASGVRQVTELAVTQARLESVVHELHVSVEDLKRWKEECDSTCKVTFDSEHYEYQAEVPTEPPAPKPPAAGPVESTIIEDLTLRAKAVERTKEEAAEIVAERTGDMEPRADIVPPPTPEREALPRRVPPTPAEIIGQYPALYSLERAHVLIKTANDSHDVHIGVPSGACTFVRFLGGHLSFPDGCPLFVHQISLAACKVYGDLIGFVQFLPNVSQAFPSGELITPSDVTVVRTNTRLNQRRQLYLTTAFYFIGIAVVSEAGNTRCYEIHASSAAGLLYRVVIPNISEPDVKAYICFLLYHMCSFGDTDWINSLMTFLKELKLPDEIMGSFNKAKAGAPMPELLADLRPASGAAASESV